MAQEETETTREVLRAALEMHSKHEPPSARDVLGIQIRAMCAQAGLPKPDLDYFPHHRYPDIYMELIGG